MLWGLTTKNLVLWDLVFRELRFGSIGSVGSVGSVGGEGNIIENDVGYDISYNDSGLAWLVRICVIPHVLAYAKVRLPVGLLVQLHAELQGTQLGSQLGSQLGIWDEAVGLPVGHPVGHPVGVWDEAVWQEGWQREILLGKAPVYIQGCTRALARDARHAGVRRPMRRPMRRGEHIDLPRAKSEVLA